MEFVQWSAESTHSCRAEPVATSHTLILLPSAAICAYCELALLKLPLAISPEPRKPAFHLWQSLAPRRLADLRLHVAENFSGDQFLSPGKTCDLIGSDFAMARSYALGLLICCLCLGAVAAGMAPAAGSTTLRLRGGKARNSGFDGPAVWAAERVEKAEEAARAEAAKNPPKIGEDGDDDSGTKKEERKIDVDELKVEAMRNIGKSLRR